MLIVRPRLGVERARAGEITSAYDGRGLSRLPSAHALWPDLESPPRANSRVSHGLVGGSGKEGPRRSRSRTRCALWATAGGSSAGWDQGDPICCFFQDCPEFINLKN